MKRADQRNKFTDLTLYFYRTWEGHLIAEHMTNECNKLSEIPTVVVQQLACSPGQNVHCTLRYSRTGPWLPKLAPFSVIHSPNRKLPADFSQLLAYRNLESSHSCAASHATLRLFNADSTVAVCWLCAVRVGRETNVPMTQWPMSTHWPHGHGTSQWPMSTQCPTTVFARNHLVIRTFSNL